MSDKREFEDKSTTPALIQPPELFRLWETMRELQGLLVSGGALGDAPERVRQGWRALNTRQLALAQQGAKADFEGMCQSLNDANVLLARAILAEDPLHRTTR
jgi:hypothetical protein